jgi:hypothetical protein
LSHSDSGNEKGKMKDIHYFATLHSDSNRAGYKVQLEYLPLYRQEFHLLQKKFIDIRKQGFRSYDWFYGFVIYRAFGFVVSIVGARGSVVGALWANMACYRDSFTFFFFTLPLWATEGSLRRMRPYKQEAEEWSHENCTWFAMSHTEQAHIWPRQEHRNSQDTNVFTLRTKCQKLTLYGKVVSDRLSDRMFHIPNHCSDSKFRIRDQI